MQAPSSPTTGDRLDLNEVNGSLLYFTVSEYVVGITTPHGNSDAVKTSVVILDGALKGKKYDDVLIFATVVRAQLCPGGRIPTDPVIVARLGKGQQKPGKSAPWMLIAPTPDDIATAERYEAAMASKGHTSAPAPAPAPAATVGGDDW